jgi:hypothetical protein
MVLGIPICPVKAEFRAITYLADRMSANENLPVIDHAGTPAARF